MNAGTLVWVVVGTAVGVSHATALWRTAHRWNGTGWWGFAWRLPLVGITLVVAALVGRLVPAAVGWAAGLAVTGVIFLVSQRWK
jgi:hypothetical protein